MSNPPPPPGFIPEAKYRRMKRLRAPVGRPQDRPNGEAHDGDTFTLQSGARGRLSGVDAFELAQTGRTPEGKVIQLGEEAHQRLLSLLTQEAVATRTGEVTYGRPVVTLASDGKDAGAIMLREGWGLAAPEYLKGDPGRRNSYLEAERLARLNRLGAFGNTFATPKAFRQGEGEPWAEPEAGEQGSSTAVFWDEPTPFQGYRKDIEEGYLALARDFNSSPEQMLAYVQAKGMNVREDDIRKFYADRARDNAVDASAVEYRDLPRAPIDPGDGATGATARGFADVPTFGALEELGALADTLGGTGGRESMFNSDRRFGDILANNLAQNNDIIAEDEAAHGWARFGGQIAGSFLPIGGAIRNPAQAFKIGLAGGGAYAFGSSNADTLAGRIPDALLGSAVGGATGVAGQRIIDFTSPRLSALARRAVRARKGLNPAEGQFGPIHYKLADKWPKALARMRKDGTGEIPNAIKHPEIGNIDLVWGNGKYGVSKIAELHPEVIDDLPAIVERLPVVARPEATGNGKFVLSDADHRAVVAPDFDGKTKRWLVTAYERKGAPGGQVSRRDPLLPDSVSSGGGAVDDIAQRAAPDNEPLPPPGFVPEEDTPASAFVEGAINAQDRQPDPSSRQTQPMRADSPATVEMSVASERPRALLGDASETERTVAAERVEPADVLPIPASTIDGVDEAERIAAGRFESIKAPDERAELLRRSIPSPRDGTRALAKRGPLDLVTWLRTKGGVNDAGGNLAHAGIDNTPRKDLDFAGGEQRFGKLIDPEQGKPLDVAAHDAWEAGYFPELDAPPGVSEFVEAINETHVGRARRFLPEDHEEVDRFMAARQQRHAVEGAEAAGAPLSADRGQSVDLADIEANATPLSAYEEWGENAPDFAGNIRLDKLDSPQAIKRALVRVDNATGSFDAARRGRIAHAETEALASDLNLTPAQLLSRRKGEAFNAEQALAARQILAKSGNELVNLARRIKNGDATERDMVAWRQSVLRHAAIQEQVAGITAEAGRALSAMRMVADSRAVSGRVLESLMEAGGGANGIKAAADMIVNAADDPRRLNTIAKTLATPRWKDKAIELWYNFLLSGPRTHAVNITSNLLTSMAQIPEHAAAAGMGAVRKVLPSQAATDRVLFSELGARSIGFLQGAREGFVQMGRTLRTGRTSDLESKVEAQSQEAIGGMLGSILRTPTRMLSAEDEMFKAMARRMEIGGLSVRQARTEGLRGGAADARVAELVANPTPEMLDKAADYGRYVTFQRPLGHGGQSVINMTNKLPFLKLFVPFVRTPINLLKFAAERSPAAPLLREWREDIAAGGVRRDLATARMMVGTGAIMTALFASADGLITGGGPADENARRLMEADGWQPYSFKIGDKSYSYQRLDPFSTTLGLAADWRDLQEYMTEKEREHTANVLVGATLQNLASKTWLSGMSNFAEAMSDPERYGGNLIANTAGSVTVPALFAQTAQAFDPLARDAQAIFARVRSRIPGASKSLPVRRDVLGQPVASANGGGLGAFSPMFVGQRDNDPTVAALLKAGVSIGKPQRRAAGRDLSPEQYDDYQRLTGETLKPALDTLTRSPEWAKLDGDGRQDAVTLAVRRARRQAVVQMFGGPVSSVGRRPAMGTVSKRRSSPPPPPGFVPASAPPPPGFVLEQ